MCTNEIWSTVFPISLDSCNPIGSFVISHQHMCKSSTHHRIVPSQRPACVSHESWDRLATNRPTCPSDFYSEHNIWSQILSKKWYFLAQNTLYKNTDKIMSGIFALQIFSLVPNSAWVEQFLTVRFTSNTRLIEVIVLLLIWFMGPRFFKGSSCVIEIGILCHNFQSPRST